MKVRGPRDVKPKFDFTHGFFRVERPQWVYFQRDVVIPFISEARQKFLVKLIQH